MGASPPLLADGWGGDVAQRCQRERCALGFDTQPVNARNTDITYSMPIANGGVHPVESGYWQIADVYTAFLKANAE